MDVEGIKVDFVVRVVGDLGFSWNGSIESSDIVNGEYRNQCC